MLCASRDSNNTLPFINPLNKTLPCCNPCVPVNIHLAKGWGYGFDPETTPTMGKLVVFQNKAVSDSIFAGKTKDINDFNAKVKEYDAEVFSGGALLHWLCPGNGENEPRMLMGQMCGSPEYELNPNAECILGYCKNSSMKCAK